MSGYIATCAMHGASALITEAKNRLDKALSDLGPDAPLVFPDTTYYLPAILGITGRAVEKLKDLAPALRAAEGMLATAPAKPAWALDTEQTLNAGIATLMAAETMEAVRTLHGGAPEAQPTSTRDTETAPGGRRDGPFGDSSVRTLGARMADGRIPGLAVILGRARSDALASQIVKAMRRNNILCFVGSSVNGRSIIQQLQEEGMGLGIDARVLPLGTKTISAIHAIGFVVRAAMIFGRLKPGMAPEILDYCSKRLPGFLLTLGELDELEIAIAAGAMCFGLPLIADSDMPWVLPTNGAAAHVVPVPLESLEGADDGERAQALVEKCIQVGGLQVKHSKVQLSLPYGSAFDEEVVQDAEMRVEFGGESSHAFQLLQAVDVNEVTDGLVDVIGPDLSTVRAAGQMDMGLVVEVAGRRMRPDFEPFLERQIHGLLSGASGIEHRGQRDKVRIRISNGAADNGVSLASLGQILVTRFREDFGAVIDKIQTHVVTEPGPREEWLRKAQAAYRLRDQRLLRLNDASVEEFYSCTLCQKVMPDQVCVISPERPGPCGANNWLDCKATSCIDPDGPIQPIRLGRPNDLEQGNWDSINGWVASNSHGVVSEISMYSVMQNPATAGNRPECVVMLIPEANGVMIVSREDRSMTPAGVTFATMSEIVSSGEQRPGVMGIAKSYLISPKFISADGGFRRVVWMSSVLKESMSRELRAVCEREGDPGFLNRIADERSVTTVHQLLPWLAQHDHPALALAPVF